MRARLAIPSPSTSVRLLVAAALCLTPMGLLWSASPGFVGTGTTLFGTCDSEGYCTPDVYIPGYFTPGNQTLVSQSPVRVFLVLAAAGFVYCAARTRTVATRRIARLATAALAVVAVLAAANSVTLVLVCMLAALALVAPPVWSRALIPARAAART